MGGATFHSWKSVDEDDARRRLTGSRAISDSLTASAGTSGASEQTFKKLVRGHAEPVGEAHEGQESDFALATLDARNLNGCQTRLSGQVFLCPAPGESGLADVGAKSFEGAVHALDRGPAKPKRP